MNVNIADVPESFANDILKNYTLISQRISRCISFLQLS